jgi:hypothetical protein
VAVFDPFLPSGRARIGCRFQCRRDHIGWHANCAGARPDQVEAWRE